ncbi:MAG: glycosyltransferase family 4 protein [Acidobacteriota bacterium]
MAKPLRILMFSESSYPRHPGGAGKCSHQLAAGLVARGHVVHLVSETTDSAVREEIDGVDVHRFARLDTSEIASERIEQATAEHVLDYLERHLDLDVIDLVHDSGGFLSYFFPVAWELDRRWGLPLVLHYRYLMIRHRILETQTGRLDLLGGDFLGFESFLHISSQGFPARFATRVVVLSEDDAYFVREHYRPRGELVTLPDPVVPHAIDASARTRRRDELGGDRGPLVLFGGRIADVRFKGTDVVFQAFDRLRQRLPDCRLILAAADDSVVGSFRDAFGSAVEALGWIGDAEALATTLAAVDLVWMPSRYEPFGLMCAEAMAVGTPVVGSPVGGLSEMICDGENGLLLSAEDADDWVDELADRTVALLRDPATLESMGSAAYRFARDHLALPVVVARVESLYREVLATSYCGEIQPPVWDDADTSAYLDRLASYAGDEARAVGRETLETWDDTVTDRCLGCTHARMAESIQELDRAGRARFERTFTPERWRRRLATAVREVCPLALRQKELASERDYLPGLRAST